jgi:hypothetical protein
MPERRAAPAPYATQRVKFRSGDNNRIVLVSYYVSSAEKTQQDFQKCLQYGAFRSSVANIMISEQFNFVDNMVKILRIHGHETTE